MKCTEILIQDHILIRRTLDVVDGMLKKLEDGQRIEICDATTVLKFLRSFGDQYHQTMDETVLFPALLRVAAGDSPFHQLISEHGGERSLIDDIEGALLSRRGMAFFRSSRQLTSLLRNHFEKEEIIVCDVAKRCLTKEQDDEIAAAFLASRTNAEQCSNLSRLEWRYLSKPPSDSVRSDNRLTRAQGSASYR